MRGLLVEDDPRLSRLNLEGLTEDGLRMDHVPNASLGDGVAQRRRHTGQEISQNQRSELLIHGENGEIRDFDGNGHNFEKSKGSYIAQLESDDAFGLIVAVVRKEPSKIPSGPIRDGPSRKELVAESGFLCGPSVGEFQQARLEVFEQVVVKVFIVVTGIDVVRDFFAGDETAVQEHPGAASGSKGGGGLEQTGQQSQAVRGVSEVLREF